MKKTILSLAALVATMTALASCQGQSANEGAEPSVVYVTRDLSPESLVKIYKALDRKAEGRVAVKISTGESEKTGYLRPDFIKPLVDEVNGTIVECNTAYPGTRNTTEAHWEAIRERGFLDIAKVDIMDEEGTMKIPVQDTTWLKYDIVGSHLQNYDFMINLAHFKGHQMAGMGGVLKNASIGVASSTGKAYIHSHGVSDDLVAAWQYIMPQDAFVESMAAAAQAVHDYFDGGKKILYIAVMYKMSIDCDCNGDPAEPLIADYGIVASLDPVAVDQACYDIVTKIHNDEHNNNQPLLDRIAQQHGTHIMEWGEKIGLGTRNYKLVSID
ncbi:MAG: DUF362 domain-containing protein [Bacteroidales bacterium]|nr:DUF362 domain-containing protein [Bacteroidales bacterium]MBR3540170.1 DUF362 domain-containing protein [Bacteroidales bacterium]